MQRRLRITLAVTAAVGALALGAGTAFADDTSQMEGNTTPSTGVNGLSGADQLGTAGQTLGSLSGTPASPSADTADSQGGDSQDASSQDGDTPAATPSTSVLGTGAPSLPGVN
ncbi:MAG TPA: hypothetical protein VGD73_18545 [Pseudonocardia sp.]|jgi:hypothetical protein|uniref:hypothetical protein n=1 Tax=Pseudonocardia sp. TaxID=60912 RepID=UPI002EDA9777